MTSGGGRLGCGSGVAVRGKETVMRVFDTGSIAGGTIENLWGKRLWGAGAHLPRDEVVTVGIVGAWDGRRVDRRSRRALRLGLFLAIVDGDNVIENSHVDKLCCPVVFNTIDAKVDQFNLHQPAMEGVLSRVEALAAKLTGESMQG